MDLFMGEPIRYWQELQRRVEGGMPMEKRELIDEIAKLRGQISFYESRAKQMAQFAEGKEE